MIEAIGTYLPRWGTTARREVGLDEDVVTMAVAAGLLALDAGTTAVDRVILVTRDLPLLEGGNSAPLLAGLGLPAETAVQERTGGAPAALEAVAEAGAGTLVIGSDLNPPGAAGVLVGRSGPALTVEGRVNRSLPVLTRDQFGHVSDYADPRLLRERGVGLSLAQAGVTEALDVVAGLGAKDAKQLSRSDAPLLPTTGASAALFALAALADRPAAAHVVAVEQATVAAASLGEGTAAVARDEAPPAPLPKGKRTSEADISISLPAYERAFDAKLRLEAAQCRTCGTLSYPHRLRCLGCGSEEPTDTFALPRDAEVYTVSTIHVPVPGLVTPYTVMVVELGDSEVRLLVHLTGAAPGSVAIGDRGRLVFRRVALRTGVPDYGYGFLPEPSEKVEVAA